MSTLRSMDPQTGEPFGAPVLAASDADVDRADAAAVAASTTTSLRAPAARAELLDQIAQRIEDLGDALIEIASRETGLPRARIISERARTTGQLRRLGRVVARGIDLDATIDHGDPTSTPPRPDLRRMNVALGPVAVFAASNFPLAFSVAGGDTAAALAVGCPVIVKAHPGHPATSALVATAVTDAVHDAGLPSGTFTVLHSTEHAIGTRLVEAPGVAAVAFTGSLAGGRALFDAAARRAVPIPVFAEMGSTNPVIITPAALAARADAIADGFVDSMTLGGGQFCTKPGVVFVMDNAAGRAFVELVATRIERAEPAVLLHQGILDGFTHRRSQSVEVAGTRTATGSRSRSAGWWAAPTIVSTTIDHYRANPTLREEHFGPAAVIVRVADIDGLVTAGDELDGSLTATIHADIDDDPVLIGRLRTALQARAGRLVWNGWPTGVAVTDAMHHGGPYPATTASATTSVGDAAVRRFVRPVCFQAWPDAAQPAALQEHNPWQIDRRVDGTYRPGK